MTNRRITGSKTLVNQTKTWFKKGNKVSDLAAATNRSTRAVYSWMSRGNIPLHLRQIVKETITAVKGK